jgi:hypothetical protein
MIGDVFQPQDTFHSSAARSILSHFDGGCDLALPPCRCLATKLLFNRDPVGRG